MSIRTTIIFSFVLAFLLLISQTVTWYNNYIINPSMFQQIFSSGLNQDSSRRALANEVVDRVFMNRPILAQLINDPARSTVYSLLGTEFFQNAKQTIVNNAHTRLTNKNAHDLTFNLAQLKFFAVPLLSRLTPELKINEIPDEIILIRQNELPSVASYTQRILFIGWISFLALILLTVYYFVRNKFNHQALRILGTIIAGFFLFYLIAVLTVRPVLLANIGSTNIRIIAENILNAFYTSYTQQLITIIISALVLLIIGYLLPILNRSIPHIKGTFTSLQSRTRKKTA